MTVVVSRGGSVDVTVADSGTGQPCLLLHGGAGPASVAGFAARLDGRVLVPTHPGFDGTPRPAWLDSVRGLAEVYAALLEELGLDDVIVIGNSVGGWIAAELALAGSARIGRTILVDAVGIVVDGHPVADIFGLDLGQIAELSYHDPEPYRIDPTTFTDAQRAALAANRATLRTYAGDMTDGTLRGRLAAIATPTLVVWGDSDGICDPDYGRAYAAAIPGARFELLADTGHVPQIESPDALLKVIAG
ncbi:alpha/beta fold hydrolase [Fodinicola acaciae]|uniref:alpha/beta fold hydrolase n=1 Tax=Fodinicola acaciae TaxID=2681555 RepID=UPI0013D038B7|nr:alpha/beta hydrolase [Fodinicola acaciae]